MPSEPTALLTQKEYAERRGCDPALICRWKKAGRIVMVDGKVDVAATDERIAATADARRVGAVRTKPIFRGQPADADSMSEIRAHRARREKADADEAEILVAQLRGQLVYAADVRRGAADCQAVTIKMLETMPDRLSERIAAECGVAAYLIRTLLIDEIRRIRGDAVLQVERLLAMYSERETAKEH